MVRSLNLPEPLAADGDQPLKRAVLRLLIVVAILLAVAGVLVPRLGGDAARPVRAAGTPVRPAPASPTR